MECPLVFFHIATTGPDPNRHDIWELGALRRETDSREHALELLIRVPWRRLRASEPGALEAGSFGDHYKAHFAIARELAARRFATFSDGAVLCGLEEASDARFLRELLGFAGLTPPWRPSTLDIASFAAGAAGLAPPWDLDSIAAALGIDPRRYARQEVLPSCRLSADLYDAACGRPRPTRASATPSLPPTSFAEVAPAGFRGRISESAEGYRAPRTATAQETADLTRRVQEIAVRESREHGQSG